MVDIHTHLLPNIDDGSKSLDDSLSQISLMAEGGISRAYLTSHYFRGHFQYTRSEYDDKFNLLVNEVIKAGIDIDLQPGFEIYLQPGILSDIKQHNLTMGKSNYILLESDLNGLPSDFYNNIYPLLRAGYKPILAHAERYVSIMQKPSRAEDLIHRNIYIQTSAGSLLGLYGEKVKSTAWILVNKGWTHFIASDDHLRGKYYSYFEAKNKIEEVIDNHTANLLFYLYPSCIDNGDYIPYEYVEVHHSHHHQHHKHSLLKRIFG
ncbi:MAG TPA: capsular biosynthesis protein [Candidatus Cloacimonas sp.]|jgi:protein-tyrosine phosphatase|nr:capsular biosynthesis protein [Candidatus Cloacimonas sp.]MDD2249609.1 capsular biosynthesis protein [Candidatus Cloacimonadota bacterium]MCK9157282.1 capsular biosynthesis protein [Candidatus Cloacimonas sp.]MCK9164531.1 capsular biosynthesis protein [Candidatus Cloacimonas sp.]MDD3733293.1 capsular biosynthesis protein [Candidatus Cloacimonadota bacterium]